MALSGTDFKASNSNLSHAVDGTDIYIVYRSDTADDVKSQKSVAGAAPDSGTISTVSPAAAATKVSASVIDHGGGKVLAVLYQETVGFPDPVGIYYDELSIAGATLLLKSRRLMTRSQQKRASFGG